MKSLQLLCFDFASAAWLRLASEAECTHRHPRHQHKQTHRHNKNKSQLTMSSADALRMRTSSITLFSQFRPIHPFLFSPFSFSPSLLFRRVGQTVICPALLELQAPAGIHWNKAEQQSKHNNNKQQEQGRRDTMN
jgi:hypothetical protein